MNKPNPVSTQFIARCQRRGIKAMRGTTINERGYLVFTDITLRTLWMGYCMGLLENDDTNFLLNFRTSTC